MVEQLGHDDAPFASGGSYSGEEGGVKDWARRAIGAVVGFVYPAQCPSCRAELHQMGGVCPECWRDISFLAGPSCRCCAAPLEADFGKNALCEVCIQDPPAWDRGAAGVEYEGVGRKLVLALKHGDRLDIAPLRQAGWRGRRVIWSVRRH